MSETMDATATAAEAMNDRDPIDAILDRHLPADDVGAPGLETEAEAAQRARDERGRFAKAEAAADAPAEAAKDEAGSPQPPGASQDQSLAAPSGWPADAQLRWDGLSRQAQAALAADLAAGKLSFGGGASGATDPIREAIKPYAMDAASIGATPDQYVAQTLELRRMIAQNPEAGLRKLAADFGVPWGAGSQPATAPAQGEDRVAQVEAKLAAWERETQQRQHSAMVSEVDAWIAEKDASGNLLRPHHATIPEDEWLRAVRAVREANPNMPARDVLQRAYEREIWATPAIRERVLEDQRKAEQARVAEETRKAAEAAKAKAISPRDNPTSAMPSRSRVGDAGIYDLVDRHLG